MRDGPDWPGVPAGPQARITYVTRDDEQDEFRVSGDTFDALVSFVEYREAVCIDVPGGLRYDASMGAPMYAL